MANEVKVNCFTLQVRGRQRRNQEPEFFNLTDVFFNTGTSVETLDFTVFFSNFIGSFDGQFQGIGNNNTAVYLPQGDIHFASERRLIYGFLKAGKTGVGRTIVEVTRPDDEVFRVTPDHVDSTEYFFLLWLPEGVETGLLMIQGFSTESASDIFINLLKKFFSDRVEGQYLVVSRYIPRGTIEMMKEDGDIDKLTLTKKNLPPDMANHMLGTTFINTDISIEIKITGLKNHSQYMKRIMDGDPVGLIRDIYLGEPRFFTTEVLGEVGMDGSHDVAFEYEYNGKKATAKQSRGFQLAPYYYVNEEDIERDPGTNLPTRDSIQAYCIDFLFPMITNEMYIN